MIIVDNLEDLYDDPDELEHSGIRGMHWGIRRFQNADGSLTPAGRRRYMKDAKWRSKYERHVAEQKAKKQIKQQETAKQRHDRLMKSSDANELYKHRSELTTQELQDRINRIRVEEDLSRYIKREPTKMEKAMAKMDKAMSTADKVVKWADSPAGKLMVKGLKKQLGIKDTPKTTDYNKFISGISGKSDKEIADMAARIKNENVIRSMAKAFEQQSADARRASERHNPDYDYRNETSPVDNPYYATSQSGDYRNGNAKFNRRRDTNAQPADRDWFGSGESRSEQRSDRNQAQNEADRRKEQARRDSRSAEREANRSYSGTVTGEGTSRRPEENRTRTASSEPIYTTASDNNPYRTVDNSNMRNTASDWFSSSSVNSRETSNYANTGIDAVSQLLGLPDDRRRYGLSRR